MQKRKRERERERERKIEKEREREKKKRERKKEGTGNLFGLAAPSFCNKIFIYITIFCLLNIITFFISC